MFGVMIWSLKFSYWVTLALAVPTAGFLVRIFIILHDCTHGSFFKSQKANDICGFFTGLFVFTPSAHWRHDHSVHHATSGDLDRRGVGDVPTWTVAEYQQASRLKRLTYRVVRNPVTLFVVGPLYYFLLHQRFPASHSGHRERVNVLWTNLALAAIIVIMSMTIGLKAYALVQLPVILLAGSVGMWLFYVQHQFEGVYWERREKWDFETQAIEGSSFYKLPKILQWFTGSIGFHHIHHLSPAIPNYYLEECHRADETFRRVKTLTLISSLKSLSFRLWDEDRRQLISFGEWKSLRQNSRN